MHVELNTIPTITLYSIAGFHVQDQVPANKPSFKGSEGGLIHSVNVPLFFSKGTFCDFLFAFMHPKSFLKSG